MKAEITNFGFRMRDSESQNIRDSELGFADQSIPYAYHHGGGLQGTRTAQKEKITKQSQQLAGNQQLTNLALPNKAEFRVRE